MLHKCIKLLIGPFTFFIVTAHAAAASNQLDQQLQETIQSFLNQNQAALHISAAQLSVLLPGESQPRAYVAGTQYYGETAPATTNQMMQWGSITKEYTNALLFQLINQGKLKTTHTLMQLLSEEFTQDNSNAWPSAWGNITVTQLMNMTSGIPSYTDIPTVAGNLNIYGQYSLNDIVSMVAHSQKQQGCSAQYGCFPAGSAYYYSNTNYFILGILVEKYSGMSFNDAINNILQPFQSQGNQVYYYASQYPDNILANMIHGYFESPGGAPNPMLYPGEDVTDINLSMLASSGALTGNMNALVKMTYALYNNQIIPINQLTQNAVQIANGEPVTSVETQCNDNTTEGCYAMGIAVGYDPELGTFYYYVGETAGYNTVYLWIPSEKVTIALSINSATPNALLLQTVGIINTIIRQYLLSQ